MSNKRLCTLILLLTKTDKTSKVLKWKPDFISIFSGYVLEIAQSIRMTDSEIISELFVIRICIIPYLITAFTGKILSWLSARSVYRFNSPFLFIYTSYCIKYDSGKHNPYFHNMFEFIIQKRNHQSQWTEFTSMYMQKVYFKWDICFIFLCTRRILQSDLRSYKLKQNLETKKIIYSTISKQCHII